MATRKIEVNEDDLKKIILMLKLSEEFMQIPPQNLQLGNLWRVSRKLADKLMRHAGLTVVTEKGRTFVRPIESAESKESATEDKTAVEKPTVEEQTPTEEKPKTETKEVVIAETAPTPTDETKVEEPTEATHHRCRKRRQKA